MSGTSVNIERSPRFVSLRRKGRSFIGNKRGAAAVEFALLGPTFLALIMSLFEVGITIAKIALLDLAVAEAAQFVYVGAVHSGSPTKAEVEQFICNRAQIFPDCVNNLTLELVPINNFTNLPPDEVPCTDSNDDEEVAPVVTYSPGAASQVMLMRVCVTTGVITPGLGIGLNLSTTDTNRMQIVSAVAFMNEPF
ncbi:MAG: TadE/TadG family type IV pilus assembly protein [Pseudomonadota bacterium]